MRILIVSQYFFPETGATSNRVLSLAKTFQDEGHQVTVLAEKPNHPRGIFFDGYEEGVFLKKKFKNVPVIYSWVYTRPQKGFLGRILFYLSFMVMAVFASFRTDKRYDIVVASSPPLFVGVSGWIISKIKRAHFVFDVRDLWPDVAVEMGVLNNNLAIKIAEKVEKFLYRKADLITAVTHAFKEAIGDKGADLSKIEVITNGTDPEVFKMERSIGQLRKSLDLGDRFYVSYVGNIGLAQGLEHIVESAVRLKELGVNDVNFLIIGDGPKKKDLKQMVNSKKAENVIFIDRVFLEKAAQYMGASNILLVPLANDPIYSQFIPSKLFDSMAASKPVLLSVDGESHKILEKSRAGIYYPAEDAGQLTEKILWLKNHPEEAEEMGSNGRQFVVENYSREVQAKRMLKAFKDLI